MAAATVQPKTTPKQPQPLSELDAIKQAIHAAMAEHKPLVDAIKKMRDFEDKLQDLETERAQFPDLKSNANELARAILSGQSVEEQQDAIAKRKTLDEKIEAYRIAHRTQFSVVGAQRSGAALGVKQRLQPTYDAAMKDLTEGIQQCSKAIETLVQLRQAMTEFEIAGENLFNLHPLGSVATSIRQAVLAFKR